MGRGRQKAKQTKVARQLKYYSPETDYRSLERELGHPGGSYEPPRSGGRDEPVRADDDGDDTDDGYGSWAADGSTR